MLALQFYDAVVAVHVMAIVVAFGVVFTYPVVLPWLRRTHPGSLTRPTSSRRGWGAW